jgi:two-component system, sensor histidine kinase PdtaS
MINLSRFQSVRARLLALMVFIIIPVAATSVILASTTYQSVIASIETGQLQTASSFAVRTRIWYRGALRTLIASVSGVMANTGAGQACEATFTRILGDNHDLKGLAINFGDGRQCAVGQPGGPTEAELLEAVSAQRTKPIVQPWGGTTQAQFRYDAITIGKALYLLTYARQKDAVGGEWEAVLLLDPALLDQSFDVGQANGTTGVALMSAGGQVIVSREKSESDLSWLPEREIFSPALARWAAPARDGRQGLFASQLVAEPDIYILARYDDVAARAARIQFVILLLTPLVIMILLFVTYARVIQSDVVRWINGIRLAAQARQQNQTVAAPVDSGMPNDIRLVAEAFNSMVNEADKREAALQETLNSNQFLMRELNHRVKNSLQVIQSYLALSRRQQNGNASRHLAETEAKVQVLSTAYRLALNDGSMSPISIKPFTEELLGNLMASSLQSGQWIKIDINVNAQLVVDRTIPLGLAFVEAVLAGIDAPGTRIITVNLVSAEDGRIHISISCDGEVRPGAPPPKIMAGLAAQLGAEVTAPEGGTLVSWTFHP